MRASMFGELGLRRLGSMRQEGYGLLPYDPGDSDEESCEDEPLPPPNFAEVDTQSSIWSFAQSGWFQVVTACVIGTNVVTTLMELQRPHMRQSLNLLDQFMLVFYIFEFISRANLFGRLFYLGPCHLVAWNVLDTFVVSAGILDEWILGAMNASHSASALGNTLKTLRAARILRIFKIVRIFLASDLSWTETPMFQSAVGTVIISNALLLGLETDIKWDGWTYIEHAFLVIYTFELLVRVKRTGVVGFLSCTNDDIWWNLLDSVIVFTSMLDSWVMPAVDFIAEQIHHSGDSDDEKETGGVSLAQAMMLMRMLRLMRILRIVKLIKAIRPLYVLVTGVVAAIQGIGWVLTLTVTVLYALALLATRMIGHGDIFDPSEMPAQEFRNVFKTVPDSMFTLFRAMSGTQSDREMDSLDQLMQRLPLIKLAFIFFMVSSSWTLLSILTAVVSENLLFTTSSEECEARLAQAEDDRRAHIKQLKELFACISACNNGIVDKIGLEDFLQDPAAQLGTAKACRVPVRDVKEVLNTLCTYGREVTVDQFVSHLVEVANPTTEKSIMKIEALFHQLLTLLLTRIETLNDNLEIKIAQVLCEQKKSLKEAALSKDILDRLDYHLLKLPVSLDPGDFTKAEDDALQLPKAKDESLRATTVAAKIATANLVKAPRCSETLAASSVEVNSARSDGRRTESIRSVRTVVRADAGKIASGAHCIDPRGDNAAIETQAETDTAVSSNGGNLNLAGILLEHFADEIPYEPPSTPGYLPIPTKAPGQFAPFRGTVANMALVEFCSRRGSVTKNARVSLRMPACPPMGAPSTDLNPSTLNTPQARAQRNGSPRQSSPWESNDREDDRTETQEVKFREATASSHGTLLS